MSLSIGIVGLPNVGKSTLFTALTNKGGLAANYPFATIEPNVGVVPVPDARLDALANIDHPTRIVPATIEFVDIAGLVAGASQGEGLGNQFLANIRETDAICEVVRFFGDPDVVHVAGRVDPSSDVDTIKTELMLADMATIEKALPRLEKEAKRDRDGAKKVEVAKKVLAGLDEGHRARTLGLDEDEQAAIYDRSWCVRAFCLRFGALLRPQAQLVYDTGRSRLRRNGFSNRRKLLYRCEPLASASAMPARRTPRRTRAPATRSTRLRPARRWPRARTSCPAPPRANASFRAGCSPHRPA